MTPPSGYDLRRQLGLLLSTARERHDLTMRDVGAKCDLSETYYGMIERGRRQPSLDAPAAAVVAREQLARARLEEREAERGGEGGAALS